MARNPAEYCLTENQMLISYHWCEKLVIGYILPCFILFGFTGNIINLSVLLAPGMKTRSNILLASLAVADMIFLLFIIPHSMAHYRIFSFNYYFRKYYLGNKMHLLAVLNWSSAAAIWLVLAVCVERLIGIRYPLSVRKSRSFHTYLIIFGIIFGTGLLTFYIHFSYDCPMLTFCNGTQPHGICMPVDSPVWINNRTNPHPQLLRTYVRWSIHINAVFIVFVPILLVVLSNAFLILTLRQRQKFLQIGTSRTTSIRGTDQATMQMRMEQKVTITVCAIVTCFTITQAPSAVVTISTGNVTLGHPNWQIYMVTATTFMVVVGKSLNFVLFCLSSANFRQRLVTMTKERIVKRRTVRRFSCDSMGTTTMTTAFSTVTDGRKTSKISVLKNKQPKRRAHSLSVDVHSQKPKIPFRKMRGMSEVNEALLPSSNA